MSNVIYLTGAPAAGKNSATSLLRERIPHLAIFEYGERLTEYIRQREPRVEQTDLREQSAQLITPEDVEAVDDLLLQFVADNRAVRPVIIDSHPVTKEEYGFRVTPFSIQQFARLRPNKIVVLYTPGEVAIERIRNDPGGRPQVSPWEAGFHTALQSSVALAYSTGARVPAYFIDSSVSREAVVDRLEHLLTS